MNNDWNDIKWALWGKHKYKVNPPLWFEVAETFVNAAKETPRQMFVDPFKVLAARWVKACRSERGYTVITFGIPVICIAACVIAGWKSYDNALLILLIAATLLSTAAYFTRHWNKL